MGTLTAGPAEEKEQPDFREIVHDLRSALGAATAYVDLARERIERAEQVTDEDLAPVARNLTRLTACVERLDKATRVKRE